MGSLGRLLVHNLIILDKIQAELTGCLVDPEFFENEEANERINGMLQRAETERQAIEDAEEELKLHMDLAPGVDCMADAERLFEKALVGQTIEDYKMFEVVKRMHWNEYVRIQQRLKVWQASYPALGAKIREFVDQKSKLFNQKLAES